MPLCYLRVCVEGVTSLPEGVSDGLWLIRSRSGFEGPQVALLSETEKQELSFVASSPCSVRFH